MEWFESPREDYELRDEEGCILAKLTFIDDLLAFEHTDYLDKHELAELIKKLQEIHSIME